MPAAGQYAPGTYFRPCEVCNTSFKVRPSEVRKAVARGNQPPRFCSVACQHSTYVGEGNPKWRGGTYRDADGYVYELAVDHPHANRAGYVRQHRLVVERVIGRFLTREEVVHHRNHVRDDNRPENLELMADGSSHRVHHGEWQDAACAECGVGRVRSSVGFRRRGKGRYCSRRCAAAVGSRASLALRTAT